MISGMSKKSEKPKGPTVDIDLSAVYTGVQTEKAVQVNIDGNKIWLAKSQMIDLGDGKVRVPAWMLNSRLKSQSQSQNSQSQSQIKSVAVGTEQFKNTMVKLLPRVKSVDAEEFQVADTMIKKENEFDYEVMSKLVAENVKLAANVNSLAEDLKVLNELVFSFISRTMVLMEKFEDRVDDVFVKADVTIDSDSASERIIKEIESDLKGPRFLKGDVNGNGNEK